jgi:molybdopterin-dependent oxidoreductase alpha subunit
MGINEKPPAWFLDRLGAEFSFAPPREHGYDVVEAIGAMRDGRAKVFLGLGGNFVSATPDTDVTAAALRGCRLTAHISTKLNKSHAITGAHALILPTIGRTERDQQATGAQVVTVEDSMGMVHQSRGSLPPASEHLLSEVAIVCRLAVATLGAGTDVTWEKFETDYDLIRDRIEAVIPGFEDFNARRESGFALPNGPRDSRTFPTATGLANFTTNPLDVLRVPAGRLILQTVRSHDQYNTTVYGLDDRYRGISSGRRVVFVNPDDLVDLGIADGEMVDLVSEWPGDADRRAESFRVVSYPTARGCCAAYFPETNVLVPLGSTAEVSNTPTSKSVVVRLERRTA